MRKLSIETVYFAPLLLIAALIVIHAPIIVGFGVLLPDYALAIKAWKELLMIAAIPLAVVLVQRRDAWSSFLNDRLLQLISAFALLHLISLIQWNGMPSVLAGLAIDLRYLLYFTLLYVGLRLYPEYKKLFIGTFTIGAVVVIGFATLQLFLPPDSLKVVGYSKTTITPYTTVDQNPDFIRLQSTLRGPNPLGAYASIVLAVCVSWLVYRRKNINWKIAGLGALSIIALYSSHSRSAYIATAIALLILAAYYFRARLRPWHYATGVVVVVFAVSALFLLRSNDFVSNVVFHEDPDEPGLINSNDGHLESLQSGLAKMLSEPFGEGIGSAGSASLQGASPAIIENNYLFVAHEVGWLGLVLFIAITSMVLYRLWQTRQDPWGVALFASGIGLAAASLFLPVWTDDTVAIVWWGLTATVLSTVNRPK